MKKLFIGLFVAVLLVVNVGAVTARDLSNVTIPNARNLVSHLHDENCRIDHGLDLPEGLALHVNTFHMADELAIVSVFPASSDGVLPFWLMPAPTNTGLTPVQTVRLNWTLDCCFSPVLDTRIWRKVHTIDTTTGECLRVVADFIDFCATSFVPLENIRTVEIAACEVLHR
ncbi:MAG: hypothetical protein FWG68_00820 [Defluviitaleaceae bacterium]|nr:hypothetical protein [Defluviitaleaceae bacterium]